MCTASQEFGDFSIASENLKPERCMLHYHEKDSGSQPLVAYRVTSSVTAVIRRRCQQPQVRSNLRYFDPRCSQSRARTVELQLPRRSDPSVFFSDQALRFQFHQICQIRLSFKIQVRLSCPARRAAAGGRDAGSSSLYISGFGPS